MISKNIKIFIVAILTFLSLKSGYSSEEDINRLEQLLAECSKNLRPSLIGGRNSQIRQKFEEDFKEIKKLSNKIQTDINKYNLDIPLIQDSNFISQSYEKIKKMKEFAVEHHLFEDMEFIFSEFNSKIKDLRETGLYTTDSPKILIRNTDFLIELNYLLEKISQQEDKIIFNKTIGSKIREQNLITIARIQFLAGKVQNAVNNFPDAKIPPIYTEANTMVQNYHKIINNITDKNPKALKDWKTALEKLHYAVKKAMEANIKVPAKQVQ